MPVPEILSNSSASSLERFLVQRAESSFVLPSNARSADLKDHGHLFEGTCAAFLEEEEITGMAVLYWNGMASIQAPEQAAISYVQRWLLRART